MMRSLKVVFLLAAVLLLVFALAGCSSEKAEPAGGGAKKVVTGEGQGFNPDAPIKVEVTLVDGKINDIKVLEHGETPGISDPAFEKIPAAIITKQSPDVDVVTNATKTSEGIMQAVSDALAK
ncbi:MAG: FMN-binding protein [Bacillota bacterium]